MSRAADPGGGLATRDLVSIILMQGEDAALIVESVRESQPDVTISDHGTYFRLQKSGEIRIDAADVADRAGRPLDVHTVLVSVASFVGRAEVDGDVFRVTAELLDLEPARG
jgi:hypothetical protein